jgi:multiple sugar transport system substrate-binding protein
MEPQAPTKRPVSRRTFLRLMGGAVASATATACASSPPPTAPSRTPSREVELVYQDSRADWYGPLVHQMIEQFNASHPNIRVYYLPEPQNQADIEQRTLTEMEAGTAADVIMGCCTWFPLWGQRHQLLDLRPYVAADIDSATIADWNPAQYRALFSKDGRQFGLPKYCGALALYYNKDLFDEHRVAYPTADWTYDDYLRAMKKLTLDLDGDGQVDVWGSMMWLSWIRYQVHINGWGGHIMDPVDDTTCRLAGPEALAALEWLRARTWDDRVMANKLRVNNLAPSAAFAGGRLAMAEDGSWALNEILSNAKFRVGVAPFPTAPARKVTSATIDGFGIYAGTEHPDAAWEFVKFLISKDFGRAMARSGLLQPARASLVGEWAEAVRVRFPEQARELDVSAFADGHVKGYAVTPEPAAEIGSASRLMNEAMESLITFGTASTDALKVAAGEIEKAQKATGKS